MTLARKHIGKKLILINRDLQFRYAIIAFFVGLIATILSWVVIIYPLFQFEILRIPKFLPFPVLSGMVFAVVVNLVFIIYFAILITHRIAGPMFALSREFAEISQGVFGRELSSRKHDDLRYLVRSFNDMSLCLKNLSLDDQQEVRLLHKQATQLVEKMSDKEDKESIKKLADRILAFQKELESRTQA